MPPRWRGGPSHTRAPLGTPRPARTGFCKYRWARRSGPVDPERLLRTLRRRCTSGCSGFPTGSHRRRMYEVRYNQNSEGKCLAHTGGGLASCPSSEHATGQARTTQPACPGYGRRPPQNHSVFRREQDLESSPPSTRSVACSATSPPVCPPPLGDGWSASGAQWLRRSARTQRPSANPVLQHPSSRRKMRGCFRFPSSEGQMSPRLQVSHPSHAAC